MNKDMHNLWEQAYPDGLEWELSALDHPVHHIIENTARQYPERPCLDFQNTKYTYSEVVEKIDRFAAGLQHAGIKKADRIGLCLPNCPYYVICYFAALKIGAVVVNFNLLYTQSEIEQQMKDSGVVMMITLDLKFTFNKIYPSLRKGTLDAIIYCPLSDLLPPLKRFLFKVFKFYQLASMAPDSKLYSFRQLSAIAPKPQEVVIDPLKDIALFQYTGGTTGTPKAAMLTHSNIVSNTEQVNLWFQTGERLSGQEKILAVLPFSHVFSMTVAMNMSLRSGAEIILVPRFELKQCLQLIKQKQITILPGVPAIFNALNNSPAVDCLTTLRYGICGGAALAVKIKEIFEARTNCKLVEGYGLSEASPVITCNPPNSGGKKGSIGLPLPGTEIAFRNIDDVNQPEQQGKNGQLLVRGPQIMQGYWNRPRENQQTLLDGGWLVTGDVGYMDDDGFVYLTDRLKDIIITNGYNVYPRVIEDAFYAHPEVAEVIAIGIPDDDKGEVPKVFVKLKEGSDTTVEELLEYASSNLNPLEIPDSIELRKELPKTLIGKPSKKVLLEQEASKRKNQA